MKRATRRKYTTCSKRLSDVWPRAAKTADSFPTRLKHAECDSLAKQLDTLHDTLYTRAVWFITPMELAIRTPHGFIQWNPIKDRLLLPQFVSRIDSGQLRVHPWDRGFVSVRRLRQLKEICKKTENTKAELNGIPVRAIVDIYFGEFENGTEAVWTPEHGWDDHLSGARIPGQARHLLPYSPRWVQRVNETLQYNHWTTNLALMAYCWIWRNRVEHTVERDSDAAPCQLELF